MKKYTKVYDIKYSHLNSKRITHTGWLTGIQVGDTEQAKASARRWAAAQQLNTFKILKVERT